jgi:hypothetical protein
MIMYLKITTNRGRSIQSGDISYFPKYTKLISGRIVMIGGTKDNDENTINSLEVWYLSPYDLTPHAPIEPKRHLMGGDSHSH